MSERRRRGGHSIIVWVGIHRCKFIGPYDVCWAFKVIVKLNSQSYCQFLDKTFISSISFKVVYSRPIVYLRMTMPHYIVLMQLTRPSLDRKNFWWKIDDVVKASRSFDLFAIQNHWAVVKKIYVTGRKYDCKANLRDAIWTARKDMNSKETQSHKICG